MNDNKLVKEGAKIILDSIKTNTKIFVPMLAPKLTMAEQYQYDSMTDEKFTQISSRTE
jgi:hypothetical protein